MEETPNYEILIEEPQNSSRKPRRTRNYMSRFERTRVISLRAEQISRGAAPLITAREQDDPLKTAERELNAGKIPFIIRRYLPNGGHEDWKINELKPTTRSGIV